MNIVLSWDNRWLIAWNNFANSSAAAQIIFKFLAEYLIYAVPIILIISWFWSALDKKIILKATLSGLIAWLGFANVIGRLINRPRPFEAGNVQELFFHRPTYSFPSDHAAFLFALAFSFWLSGAKKLGISIFILALLIGVARIATGVHFPSDIIAGAILGIIVAYLIHLLEKPLQVVYNFLIKLSKKIKLA